MEIRLRRSPAVVLLVAYVALSSWGRFDGAYATSTRADRLDPSAMRATRRLRRRHARGRDRLGDAALALLPGAARRRARRGTAAVDRGRDRSPASGRRGSDGRRPRRCGRGRGRVHPDPARSLAPTDHDARRRLADGRVPSVVFTLPLLFSRDVYSYAYYGRIWTSYGANPYVLTPKRLPLQRPVDAHVAGVAATPSVYGPLFTWVSVITTGFAAKRRRARSRVPSARGGLEPGHAVRSCGAW